MAKSNFQVERDGAVVKIWLDSGADVDNCMIAFSRECATEIEASFICDSTKRMIEHEIEEARDIGMAQERASWEEIASNGIYDRAEQSKRILESIIHEIKTGD